MNGRLEVARLRARLDSAFKRVDHVTDLETRAHFARYLCVLVSGYLERACEVLALEFCRKRSSADVLRYVGSELSRFQNANSRKVVAFVTAFNPDWGPQLEGYIAGERAAAIDSVVARRHQIAHGDDAGISFVQIKNYYIQVQEVVEYLVQLYDPAPIAA